MRQHSGFRHHLNQMCKDRNIANQLPGFHIHNSPRVLSGTYTAWRTRLCELIKTWLLHNAVCPMTTWSVLILNVVFTLYHETGESSSVGLPCSTWTESMLYSYVMHPSPPSKSDQLLNRVINLQTKTYISWVGYMYQFKDNSVMWCTTCLIFKRKCGFHHVHVHVTVMWQSCVHRRICSLAIGKIKNYV